MSSFDRDAAILLAASEAVPAEWRDLSDLLERLAQRGTSLAACLSAGASRDRIADYLAHAVTEDQIDKWQCRLDCLAKDHPTTWLVPVTDRRYPENLRTVYDRPPFLFVKGTLTGADRRAIAVVGSRDAPSGALQAAAMLAQSAAASRVTVVSGLARGIDAAAHHGALAAGGRTIAVVGTGIDQIYPPEHAELGAQITSQGAIVSQFRPGSPGTKSSFPMRNAVIAGLSLASVLIVAGERSGTRSEAEAALRHNRRVLLWKPILGKREWAQKWVEYGAVEWASSAEDVLAGIPTDAAA